MAAMRVSTVTAHSEWEEGSHGSLSEGMTFYLRHEGWLWEGKDPWESHSGKEQWQGPMS